MTAFTPVIIEVLANTPSDVEAAMSVPTPHPLLFATRCAARTQVLISSAGIPRFSSPKAISRSTENMKIWFSGFRNSSPTFWARSLIRVFFTSRPPTDAEPSYTPNTCGDPPVYGAEEGGLPASARSREYHYLSLPHSQ